MEQNTSTQRTAKICDENLSDVIKTLARFDKKLSKHEKRIKKMRHICQGMMSDIHAIKHEILQELADESDSIQ
ncbi:hypothetical protein LU293_07355 [Moraxella nasovis]|uniref:hypothetical protein n=1 Tax=Moraxella nasovis TaxID=2904121 RepID=UPI001F6091FD|nr:hypothetical protein [Moraxella nasovis]UNU72904.1 hypothetical protein LU293_07355 [Moraxella nasovis]